MNDTRIRDNVSRILEEQRSKRCLSMSSMAKLLSIDESQYKRIVYGQTNKISALLVYNICIALGIDAYEIYGVESKNLDYIRDYFRLSQRQRNYINSLIRIERNLGVGSQDSKLPVLVPTGNMDDGMIIDSANVIHIDYKIGKSFPMVSFGIMITSNHLHPCYHENDILLISCESPRHGDTGIFIDKENGRAYIRKYFQGNPCILEPINGHGKTFAINPYNEEEMEKWIKFGYVVTKIRK